MNDPEALQLVARYNAGPTAVLAALDGASDAELDYRDGDEWSARMVVHHLADSETNSYIRLRRLLAEEPPTTLQGYDEGRWGVTAALGYETWPVDVSLQLFLAVRAASAQTLVGLSDEDLERTGVHSESGPYGLRDWLRIYAEHVEQHADQISRARKAAP